MNIYGTIEKTEPQEDGTLKVWGYASSEVVDSAGEIITADAMKAAIPDYMAFGAVREMHDAKKAAGTAIEIEVREDGRTYFGAHVVDGEAVKKVQHGVYKGFSIGGKVLGRDELAKNTITGLKLTEISLVDRPANPEATFTMFKADGAAEPVEEAVAAKGEPVESAENTAELEHDLRKYAGEEVMDVSIALRMLDDAFWLLELEKSEREQYPEQIVALKQVIKSLKAFIVSEIQEENGEEPKAAAEEAGALEKADESEEEPIEELAKIEELETRNGELAKRAEELAASNETLAKRLRELEEQPEAPKAIVKAITKEEDGNAATQRDELLVKNYDGSINDVASEIRKIHQRGGIARG